jgi:hypothetical protein
MASLREGGGPPQVVEGAREHKKVIFFTGIVALFLVSFLLIGFAVKICPLDSQCDIPTNAFVSLYAELFTLHPF